MRNNKIIITLGAITLAMLCCLGVIAVFAFQAFTSPSFSTLWQQFTGDVAGAYDLRQKVIDEYHVEEAGVAVERGSSGRVLKIKLADSYLNKLPSLQQTAKARQVASFAKKNLPAIKTIDTIKITITAHWQGATVDADELPSFDFDVKSLPED